MKTMLLTRKSMPRSSRQSDYTKTTILKRRRMHWYGHGSHSSGLAKTILQGTVKGGKTRQTEKEVGRECQGVDRPGARQVPGGVENREKWRKLFVKVICGAPTTLKVKGKMKVKKDEFWKQ